MLYPYIQTSLGIQFQF